MENFTNWNAYKSNMPYDGYIFTSTSNTVNKFLLYNIIYIIYQKNLI